MLKSRRVGRVHLQAQRLAMLQTLYQMAAGSALCVLSITNPVIDTAALHDGSKQASAPPTSAGCVGYRLEKRRGQLFVVWLCGRATEVTKAHRGRCPRPHEILRRQTC